MVLILILLSIGLLFSIIYIFLLKKKQREINQQLEFILHSDTNLLINSSFNEKETQKTIQLINSTIKKKRLTEKQSYRLEKNLRSLINNVAHDLRTPLTVSKGYLQMAQQVDLNKETKEMYIEKTSQSLNRLSERISILFEYTKLQEQKGAFIFENINITQLLEEQCLAFYQPFNEHNFEVNLDIEKSISMYGHPDSLKSLFQNVLDNTIKHGEKLINIALSQDDFYIYFTCENKTPQKSINTEAIFDRFYTEDMSRNNANTGLGLPIIKDLTLLHHGKITIDINQDFMFSLMIQFSKKTVKQQYMKTNKREIR